jgi:hypothetical protein
MIELGKRTNEVLAPIADVFEPPLEFPSVPRGSRVICGLDQGLGERLFVCNSLADMEQLYDAYARGDALRISWYSEIVGGTEPPKQE